MSAASTASSPTRAQLVHLVKAALQKGPQFQNELQRRAAAGEWLVLRGVKFEADILREALVCEDHPKKETVHQKPDECGETAASESLKDGPPSEGCPPSAPSAVAQTASGARWTPPGGAARWTPGPVSDALLAARAAMECENAEPFCRSVRVIGGAKVGLLQKPEALGKPIDHLSDGQVVEVIARCHLLREGRVYLRLKSKVAWVCTRSRKIFSKIVLTGADTDELLEPAQCAEMEASEAMVLLPAVDVQGNAVPTGEEWSMLPTMASQASSAESAVFEDSQPMSQDVSEEPPLEDMVEDHAETGDEEVDEEAHDDEVDGSENEKLEEQQATKRFRVVISSCPIMATPEIFRQGAKPVKMLKLNNEFNADGVFYSPAEHRAYLHLNMVAGGCVSEPELICTALLSNHWLLVSARTGNAKCL